MKQLEKYRQWIFHDNKKLLLIFRCDHCIHLWLNNIQITALDLKKLIVSGGETQVKNDYNAIRLYQW